MIDFVPDAPVYSPGVLFSILDLVPTVGGGYKCSPTPFAESYSAAPTADVIGSALLLKSDGTRRLLASSQTKVYEANGSGAWTDRTGGTAYSCSAGAMVTFCQLGSTTVMGTGLNNLYQSSGAAFSDIAGSPAAKIVIAHANAVLAFNTASQPDGWYRSDTGDSTNWTATASNEVDSGNLYGGIGGPITHAGVWQGLALAFKARGSFVGRYVSTIDDIVRWDVLDPAAGCVSTFGGINTEIGYVFVSDRDILLFDGGKPRSIADKVRRAFVRAAYTARANIFVTLDEAEHNVYFWYGTSTYPNRAWVWNYTSGKWGFVSRINNSSSAYTYMRCPVVNANYADYTAVGTIGTNSNFQANPMFANGGILVNFTDSDQNAQGRAGGPTVTTSNWGRNGAETTLSRLWMLYESNSYPSAVPTSASVSLLKAPGSSIPAAVTARVMTDGNIDVNRQANWFSASIQWGASAGSFTLNDIQPDYRDTSRPLS